MADVTETALTLMRDTRERLMGAYGKIEAVEYKSAHNHDAVTELDRWIERHLAKELARKFPAIGFVGEEYGGNRAVRRFWLCDPIDGTSYFIRGMPHCTSMLALIEDGEVVFSVIYDFVNNILYHAERGNGAFGNGSRLRVSNRPVKAAYLAYETKLDDPKNLEIFLRLRTFAPTQKVIASGYEHLLVATGKIEGRVNFGPWGKDYDYAPGALLVKEAGGIVANLGLRTYDYRNYNYIAANAPVFAGLTAGENPIFPIQ